MRAPSRDVTPPWIRPVTDRLSPTITVLVVVNALVYSAFLLVAPLRMPIQDYLALTPNALAGLQVWQLASALFVHLEPLSFFFDLLGLWFVGATIERQLGRTRFLVTFFVPALAGNLAIAGLVLLTKRPEIYAGFGLAVLAMFVAFGRIYDRTPARIFGGLVLEARTLTLILIGFALFGDIMRGSLPALAGDVVAILGGYLLAGGRGEGLRDLFTRLGGGKGPSKPSRRRFSVVEGGRQEDRRTRYLN